MDTSLFDRYANTIRNLSAAELVGGGDLDKKMLLAHEGALSVCYSPDIIIHRTLWFADPQGMPPVGSSSEPQLPYSRDGQ